MSKEDVLKQIREKPKKEIKVSKPFVPTGADLLDIITGDGYPAGDIVNIIGDSSAGKTFIACEAIYAAKKKYKKKVKVRYNDAESGFKFDTEKLYGFDLKKDLVKTDTIQEFMADLGSWTKKIKDDEIGFYVVDSFDGLCSDADLEEYENRVKEYEKGKDYKKGTYDMSKQKFSSKLFRTMSRILSKKNVLLIIISQIRDNVGVMYGARWTVSGGKALKFYSDCRLFLRSRELFKEQNRQIGYCVEVTGIKTRTPYPNRQCYINILHDYGMDNISSNLDYLFDLKEDGKLVTGKCKSIAWKENSKEVSDKTVKTFMEDQNVYDQYKEEFKIKRFGKNKAIEWIMKDDTLKQTFMDEFGTTDRETLIHHIEDNELETEFSDKAKKKWWDIEEAIRPKRKKKEL